MSIERLIWTHRISSHLSFPVQLEEYVWMCIHVYIYILCTYVCICMYRKGEEQQGNAHHQLVTRSSKSVYYLHKVTYKFDFAKSTFWGWPLEPHAMMGGLSDSDEKPWARILNQIHHIVQLCIRTWSMNINCSAMLRASASVLVWPLDRTTATHWIRLAHESGSPATEPACDLHGGYAVFVQKLQTGG